MLSGNGERLFYETYQNKIRVLNSQNLTEIIKVGFKKFIDAWVPSHDGKGLFFGFRESWTKNSVVAFLELGKLERGVEIRVPCFWGFGTLTFLTISPSGKKIFAGKRDRWVAFDVENQSVICDKRAKTNITNLVVAAKNERLLVVDWDRRKKVGLSMFSFSKTHQENNNEIRVKKELEPELR